MAGNAAGRLEGSAPLRELLAALPLPAVGLDRDGRVTSTNGALVRMGGWTTGDLLGKDWCAIASPAGRDEARVWIRGLLGSRDAAPPHESAMTTPRGTRVVRWNAAVLRDGGGAAVGATLFGEDVTDQRRTEEALAKLSMAVEQSPAIVVMSDATWTVSYVNRRFTEVTGFAPEEVIGTSADRLRDQTADERRRMKSAVERGGWQGELRARRKGGGYYVEWASISPVRDRSGALSHYIKVAEDVTERRRTEEALRRSMARAEALAEEQRVLLENTLDFVYRHDVDGVFTYLSPAVETITGYTVQEWLKHYTTYMTDNPINRKVVTYTEDTLRTGKQSPPYIVEIRHKDDRLVLLEVNERAYLEGRRIAGIVGVARDVSERERARSELLRTAAQMRRAYEDLKRAQDELIRAEKLASIGMLVSGVAHEINNPISVIYGNLKLLRQELSKGSSAKVRAMLRDAERASVRAHLIIQEFRNFARDTRTAEPVDLNRGIEETLAVLKKDFGTRIRIVRKFGRIPPVRCLKGQMNQVFFNLLRNALESIEHRGTITIRTRADRGLVHVEVSDTGRGMSEEVQKKLFEPFFTTKDVGKGLGLGLSISATIVQNHGGRIRCRSRAGRGSTFTVELPAGV